MDGLSLCMIVKNEQQVLAKCLNSVKDIVDEIIITDTGSTDNTVRIAQEFTDKIYHFKWNNNFSEARNYAKSHATSKWILVLDADEFVDRDNLLNVKNNIINDRVDYDGYTVDIYNFLGYNGEQMVQHKNIRIYKNDPSIYFKRSIHEQLTKSNGNMAISESGLLIYHSGYLSKIVENKDKKHRNRKLLEREIAFSENKSFDYFNMANECFVSEDMKEAAIFYEKAYNLKSEMNDAWIPLTLVNWGSCLIILKRFKEAIHVLEIGEKLWENAPEFIYLKSQAFIGQNCYEDARELLIYLTKNKQYYKGFIKSSDYLELHPYISLGKILEKENNITGAIDYFSHAMAVNRNNIDAFYGTIKLLVANCSKQEVIEFISKHNLADGKYLVIIIKILLEEAMPELAEFYLVKLDKSLKIIPGIKTKLLMLKGQFIEAIDELRNLKNEELMQIMAQNFITKADILLLCYICKDVILIQKIEGIIDVKSAISLIMQKKITVDNQSNIYLSLLDRSVKYRWYEIFEQLLEDILYDDSALDVAIGNLLCIHGFNQLALSFFSRISDDSKLDETAYVNIVESLIGSNDLEYALEYAIKAIEKDCINFRLFKSAIELCRVTGNSELMNKVLREAMEIYPHSDWVKLQFRKPLSNSNKVLENKIAKPIL